MFLVEKLFVALIHRVVNPSTPQLKNLYKSLKTNSTILGSICSVLFHTYTLTSLIFQVCRPAATLKHRRHFRILLLGDQHVTFSTLLPPTSPSISFVLFLWCSILPFLRNPSFPFAACTYLATQSFLQTFCKGSILYRSIQHNFQSFWGNIGFSEWLLKIISRYKETPAVTNSNSHFLAGRISTEAPAVVLHLHAHAQNAGDD